MTVILSVISVENDFNYAVDSTGFPAEGALELREQNHISWKLVSTTNERGYRVGGGIHNGVHVNFMIDAILRIIISEHIRSW